MRIEYSFPSKTLINRNLNQSSKVEVSPVLPKNEYTKLKYNSEKRDPIPVASKLNETNEDTHILRKNLYVTNFRKDFKINQDFVEKEVIPNVSSVSKDTPSWLQSTMKYFFKDFHETVRSGVKSAFRSRKKADVFGNPVVEFPRLVHPFQMVPPYTGQLRDKKAVVLVERRAKSEMRGCIFFSKTANNYLAINLSWQEDPLRQSYDKGKVAPKIGRERVIPLIQTKTPTNFRKIGESELGIRLKAPRVITLKIGHDDNVYTFRNRDNSCNESKLEKTTDLKE